MPVIFSSCTMVLTPWKKPLYLVSPGRYWSWISLILIVSCGSEPRVQFESPTHPPSFAQPVCWVRRMSLRPSSLPAEVYDQNPSVSYLGRGDECGLHSTSFQLHCTSFLSQTTSPLTVCLSPPSTYLHSPLPSLLTWGVVTKVASMAPAPRPAMKPLAWPRPYLSPPGVEVDSR